MRSPHFLASNALVQAAATAVAASLVYLLIGRMLDPDSLHLGAAVVVGLTLGIHVYRRARARIASKASRHEHLST